jgi:LysM repeat protein
VLSNIARANNTTVARILELNPNLRNRRNYMIYANERLRLP